MSHEKVSDFFEGVSKFFSKRLVGIYYGRKFPNRQPEFRFGSGFVVESHGDVFFVTASHIFEEIDKWQEEDNFIGIVLAFDASNGGYYEYRMSEDDLDSVRFWPSKDLDLGIMPLRGEAMRLAKMTGLLPIDRQLIAVDPPGPSDLRLVIGYSANDSVVFDNDLFVYYSEGRTFTHKVSKVASLTFRMVQISTDVSDSGERLTSIPLKKDTPSVAGLSGGFVIDLPIGTRDYRWVGIQSSQGELAKSGQSIAKSISYVKASVAMDAIDTFVAECIEHYQQQQAEADD